MPKVQLVYSSNWPWWRKLAAVVMAGFVAAIVATLLNIRDAALTAQMDRERVAGVTAPQYLVVPDSPPILATFTDEKRAADACNNRYAILTSEDGTTAYACPLFVN